MVDTLVWVLAGLAFYTVVAMGLRARGLLPPSVRIQGPITTIHTQRGKAFLDWLAGPRRFWRAWGNLGIGIALVIMVGSFLAVLFSAYSTLTQPTASAITEPRNVLVIPGVNDFLPLSAAPEIVLGLLIGLVVHEGGHGLLCRVEDIKIESMGLALLTLIPVGAFVEPDEESRQKADRGGQTRMFAAGVTNNFAISLVAFALLFGPVVGSIAVVPGAPVGNVADGSAAAAAGLQPGDVITQINGQDVTSASELDAVLANESRTVDVSLKSGEQRTVERSLIITGAVPRVVEGIDLSGDPPTIQSVNGTQVGTEAELRDALQNRTVSTIQTDKGSATFAAGALVQVSPDGPLTDAGAPEEETMVITSVNGTRTVDQQALQRALANTQAGQTVTIEGVLDGEQVSYDVELDENPRTGGGLLGVFTQPGISGVTVDDFGVDPYPADEYLAALGGDGEGGFGAVSFIQRIGVILFLPFASVLSPGLSYNFAGFVDMVTNFYEIRGPLAFLGGGVFTLANVLFWSGWVNLQLGFFNCIPAFPLDGGHILRTSTEAIVSRLPVQDGRELSRAITTSISLTMLAGLVVMIFGPQLLA
ncbi:MULTISPECIES: site-2 protease family protein [unclassified Haladaptatus]|uniref:site-2 protease family protein n=1 Tax=unclassified Haladaptatus TaxID=2622732 RepID=UPI0023E88111|nr:MULTISPECIES: site-2 protease family protein [unclassified Haladaptatus]